MSIETFGDLLAPNLDAVRRSVRMRLRTQDHVEDVLQQTLFLVKTRIRIWLFFGTIEMDQSSWTSNRRVRPAP